MWLGLAYILLILAIVLETRLLVYLIRTIWVVRIHRYSLVIHYSGIVGVILTVGFDDLRTGEYIILISLIFLYYIIRDIIFYPVKTGEFVEFDKIRSLYQTFVEGEPEMAVVLPQESTNVYVVPGRILAASDVIITENNDNYSLTYCLLCNTMHAYRLPIIDGTTQFISSYRGMVLNGNKVLMDNSKKYIWQQFNGKALVLGIPDLTEEKVVRLHWSQVGKLFPDAKYFKGNVSPVSHFFFRFIGSMVRTIPFFGMTSGGKNPILARKELVVGVSIMNEARAYPYQLFQEDTVLEDELGSVIFTLLFHDYTVIGYRTQDLVLRNDELVRGENVWKISGEAIGDHDDLELLPITDKVYWYIWNLYFPNTDVYE